MKKSRAMAPRVGFEPTTNRLTVDCSTAELPRIRPRRTACTKISAAGKAPWRDKERWNNNANGAPKKRGGRTGPPKALGMVGCLQGKTVKEWSIKVKGGLSDLAGR